ncbi:sugar-binding transcriptional regulator [Actinomyces marmotae]|uniref:Sugar-binding protein n=1 Tax=Actinomyces marmotae TaxID=2737173 RepID=A0A6M8B6G7_9ACTO|nr:sugar-binding domain-containing protein [Actinomyces marmotae]QKD80180.1 sugar-binding protein [Actinomyces marmotae]
MCAATSRSRLSLLLDVARLYWEDGLDQAAVASRLGYSRPTVSRMLAEARREGVVTITVAHPIERLMGLEEELMRVFGLKQARVCEARPPGEQGVSAELARSAGQLLLEHVGRRCVVAVSNGRAVGAVAHHLPEQIWPDSMVVAMVGSAGESFNLEDGPNISRSMALRLGGHYRNLTVPLVFDSLAMATGMRQEEQVSTTIELAARSDAALTGIGAVGDGLGVSPLLRRWMTPEVIAECRAKGVVAHICGHHLDANGRHVHTAICERTLCLGLERLAGIPLVIGVAAGADKTTAILAALRSGYLSALATDEPTARAVLAPETARR